MGIIYSLLPIYMADGWNIATFGGSLKFQISNSKSTG